MDIYIYIVALVLCSYFYLVSREVANVINKIQNRTVELERQCRLYQKQLNYLSEEIDNIKINKNK